MALGFLDKALGRDDESDRTDPWSVSTGDDRFASKVAARISRAEWEDWKQRFLPVLEEAADMVSNPAERLAVENRAVERVADTFGGQRGDFERQRSQLGLRLDDTERTAVDRGFALDEARTRVAARNSTRQGLDDLEMQLLGGGLAIGG